MYSSLSSPTHHIFFPPRLEVVVNEQYPDGFPSHARNQSSFHGFLGYQPHGPAGAALGRVTANHGDNALPLAILQHRGCSRALLLVEGTIETSLRVAMSDLPNRLRSQRNNAGNARSTGAPCQLKQRERPQNDSHLLHAASE